MKHGDTLLSKIFCPSICCLYPTLFDFCSQDERRKKIIEMGGAQELLNMLATAKDDRTRKAALQALDALSHSGGIIIL